MSTAIERDDLFLTVKMKRYVLMCLVLLIKNNVGCYTCLNKQFKNK